MDSQKCQKLQMKRKAFANCFNENPPTNLLMLKKAFTEQLGLKATQPKQPN
jgi:uncharacterized protein YneF (UPF0154 family)